MFIKKISAIAEHPLVTRLCGLAAADPAGGQLQDQATIDHEVHPLECFQVVDADSSQAGGDPGNGLG